MMRCPFALGVVAALILCFPVATAAGDKPPALPAGTTVEYDKFHDYTLIRLKLGEFTDAAGTHVLSIYASHPGEEAGVPETATVGIYKYSPHWEYLEHHDVVVMCGDRRLKTESTYRSKVNTKAHVDPCDEFIHIRFGTEELGAMLGKGKDLEIKIGSHPPLPLGPRSRRQVAAFVTAVRSGAY